METGTQSEAPRVIDLAESRVRLIDVLHRHCDNLHMEFARTCIQLVSISQRCVLYPLKFMQH